MLAPSVRSSSGSTAFTLPCVPTGMNAGVGTSPCAVCTTPARAAPSVATSVKLSLTTPRTMRVRARQSARLSTAPARGRARAGGSARAPQRAPRAEPGCRATSPRASRTARTRRASLRARARRGCARTRATRSRFASSQDQHRIAEGVEAVLLFDRKLVQASHLLDTGERHHERQQRRARQVKIREERVDAPELEARHDEELGATGERRVSRERLERAHRGRADRQHAFRGLDPIPRFRRDLVALAVDHVFLDALLIHGPERVEADVQRHALDVECGEQLRREMQPGRGRGRRARFVRIDRLVALGLLEPLRDVRRQRRLPLRLAVEPEPPAPFAEVLEELHRAVAPARLESARRTREPFPDIAVESLEQQHLSARRGDGDPRGHDAGVVDDDELTVQLVGQLCETPVALDAALERAREQVEALAAMAAELESTLPTRVGDAVQDGLRAQVLPVGRNLAEIRGLMNQLIRRLERVEGDLLSERHARVDDLALLVDPVTSGWRGVEQRLTRIEERLTADDSATVYRMAS